MGGKKLHLSIFRKCCKKKQNERIIAGLKVSIPVKHVACMPPLSVSFPISSYCDRTVADCGTLHKRLTLSPLPPTWVINEHMTPVIISKLRTFHEMSPPRVDVLITLIISSELTWNVSFPHCKLNSMNCDLFHDFPAVVANVLSVQRFFSLVDSSKVCVGNADSNLLEMWQKRSMTLHGCNSN